MSVSDKQLAANRANAQKSTGPTSEEGKNRSRLNGMRHGLTGLGTIMTDEDRRAQDSFVDPFVEELAPVGIHERQLAWTIAVDHFRLNRLKAVEENTFAHGHFDRAGDIEAEHPEIHHAITQARVFSFEGRTFHNLSLYEQRLTRAIHKNLQLYYQLQDRRRAKALAEPEISPSKSEQSAPEPKSMTAAAAAPRPDFVLRRPEPENGFAFSNNPEIPPRPLDSAA